MLAQCGDACETPRASSIADETLVAKVRYRAAVSPGGPRGPEALSRSSRGESGASVGCKGVLQERKVERGGTEAEVERASHRGRRSLEASKRI